MNNDENIIDDYFIQTNKVPEISVTLIIIFGFAGLVGILFKVLHWPLGDELLILGWGGLSGYLTAIIFFLKNRTHKIKAYIFIMIVVCLIIFRFPYLKFLCIYFGIIALTFLLTFFILSKSKKSKDI